MRWGAIAQVYQNNREAAEVLLQQGADPNVENSWGERPLHIIACDLKYCDRTTAEADLLLKYGATVDQSAIDRAIEANRPDLIELLQRHQKSSSDRSRDAQF